MILRNLAWPSRCLLSLVCLLLTRSAIASDWVYFTEKDDTLWDLCLKYTNKRGCWIELGKYNGIANDRTIPIGTEVRIPAAWLLRQPAVGRLLDYTGDVTLLRSSGDSVAPEPGALLYLGDRLATGAGSVRIALGAGKQLQLRPGSELTLENLSSIESAAEAGEVSLTRGEVSVDVVPERGIRFQVDTPAAIAAVRGTGFRVASSASGKAEMRLEVLQGRVSAEGATRATVPRGQGLKVREGEAPGELVALLPAPVLTQQGTARRLPFTLAWNAAPGAVAWSVDIHDGAGDQDLLRTVTTSTPALLVEDLARQCYVVTLSAIDGQGFRGMESDHEVCVAPPLAVPAALTLRKHLKDHYGHEWVFDWRAVADASRYRVEVARDGQFAELVHSTTVPRNTVRLFGLGNGTYYLRVAAVDDQGAQGEYSDALRFEQKDRWGGALFGGALLALLALL